MYFDISGTVTEGEKIGRFLGYPTANLPVEDDFPASDGVYACIINMDGGRYYGMAYLGRRPTMNEGTNGHMPGRVLEINIFSFEGSLYGRTLDVELIRYMRPEIKFDTVEQLRQAIEKDKQEVIKHFKLDICS